MASTFTPLGIELMATGENAGTWGTKTNANLNLVEQISGGYIAQAIAGTGTTAFAPTDGGTGAVVASRVIEFTGALTGSRIITFPVLTENIYLIKNATTGTETLQLKAATGSGATVTWATDDKGWKLIYFDGVTTNTGVYDVGFGAATGAAGSTTQVQFNDSGAFAGDANLTWTAATALLIDAEKELRLGDNAGAEYVGLKAPATVGAAYTLTLPAATGTANQVISTNGSGVLSFVDNVAAAAGSTTQVQFNNSGAFAGDADLTWTAGTALTINSQKELRLADTDDSAYVGLRSHATVSGSYTLTFPAATGTADQILVTDGSGNLSFTDNSGGTSWVAVKTANYTASAGEGVFCNTTGGSFTLTLPSSPTQGDEVSFVDYAGTFDSNALTVGRNSQPIQGAASDLTVSIERAANTLVYVDGTQGWLLKTK
jgi:hypothetical protein